MKGAPGAKKTTPCERWLFGATIRLAKGWWWEGCEGLPPPPPPPANTPPPPRNKLHCMTRAASSRALAAHLLTCYALHGSSPLGHGLWV